MAVESLERFRGYVVKCRRTEVGGRALEVMGPANYEGLVDEQRVAARFEQDEYMPYWGELWPASLLLADAVAAWAPALSQREPPTVLEVGCGLGLVSLVALRLGYSVTASDCEDDALAFVAYSARRNRLPPPTTRHLDWRQVYPELRFDRIVAADVLYESRSLRPVAEFVHNHLAEGGFALISDQNRSTADAFQAMARHCGLACEACPAERRGSMNERVVRGRIFHVRRKPADGDG